MARCWKTKSNLSIQVYRASTTMTIRQPHRGQEVRGFLEVRLPIEVRLPLEAR
jgi:hypothetical protein